MAVNLLGEMLVKIVGDTTGLTRSLSDSQKQAVAFGVNVAAAAVVVTKLVDAVATATKQYVVYGSAINDASQRTGLSTKAIQEWKFIAEQSGTTMEAVTTAVGAMTRGLSTNADTYKLLGVELKNSNGTLRSTSDIFNDTVRTLASMTDETQRDQLAFQLLGRSAQSLIPILNSGSKGIELMAKEANNLGIILDDKAIKNADRLGDSADALKASMSSAKNVLVNDMAPALISITDGFKNMIEGMLRTKKEIEAYREATSGTITDLDKNSLALAKVTSEQDRLKKLLDATMPNDELRRNSLKGAIADNEKLEKNLRTQRSELVLIEKQKLKDAGATERQAKSAADKFAADSEAAAKAKELEKAQEKITEAEERLTDAEKENTKVMKAESGKRARLLAEQERDRLDMVKKFETATTSSTDIEIENINRRRDAFIAAGVSEVAAETLATQQKAALITGYAINTNLQIELMKVAYQGLGDTFKSVFQQLGEDIANGELSWKSLGTAAIRSIGRIVSAIGDELAAKAAATLVEAWAASSNPFTAWAAPGLFRSASKLGTGAAAAYATGAGLSVITLATGGQVSDPTLAVVGDNPRYDEIVAPLSPEVFSGIADGIVNALAQRARPAGVTPATAGAEFTATGSTGRGGDFHLHVGQMIADDAGIRKLVRTIRPYLQQENVRVGG